MTGWLIALGILILLAILPLGVSVIYNEDGPLVRVIAGFIRIKVFPSKKKDKKEKKKKEKPRKTEAKKTVKAEKKKTPSKKGGSIMDFLPLVKVAVDFLNGFRKKLRVNLLELKLTMAGGDPADLAINYGRTWAALGNLWPHIDRMFTIKKRDIRLQCDFEGSQTLVNARVEITITLARLLGLVFNYGFRIGFRFLKIMLARNKAAKAENKNS